MYAVIMAGGGGTRLWPLSRAARPKPFLPLLPDGRSLLGATVSRLVPLIPLEHIHVVTDARHADLVGEQVPGMPMGNILLEPTGRNTAAAVALAALAIERPAEEVMVVLPADQSVLREPAFRDALRAAAGRAASGDMVTLGIRPEGPSTGYGYVVATGEAQVIEGHQCFRVARFEEKPTLERARQLIDSGTASWNAGIFVWRRDTVLAGLDEHAPDIMGALRRALDAEGTADATAGVTPGATAGPDLATRLAGVYPDLPATSIDYALLEPASLRGRVAVVPADIGWSDLGSWAAMRDVLVGDGGTTVVGPQGAGVIEVGTRDVLIHAGGGRLVAVVGVADAVVIDTPDALLVCSADAAQDVKAVVDRLAAEGRRELL